MGTLRKRIEEVFGWIKAQAGRDHVKVRGRPKAEAVFKTPGPHRRMTAATNWL